MALEVVKQRLGQQDRTRTNSAICGNKKKIKSIHQKKKSHSERSSYSLDIFALTRKGWSQQLIRQKLQVFQGDVTDSRYVEKTGEGVRIFGGEDVEQGHSAV